MEILEQYSQVLQESRTEVYKVFKLNTQVKLLRKKVHGHFTLSKKVKILY